MNFFFIRELKHPPQRRYTPFANNCFSLRSTPQSMPPHARAEKHLVLRITTATRKKRKQFMSEITGPHAYWATSTRTFDALRRRHSPEEFKSMKIRFCKFPFCKRSLTDTYKISALSLRMFLLKERESQPKVKLR